jgi:hypothetical protein
MPRAHNPAHHIMVVTQREDFISALSVKLDDKGGDYIMIHSEMH